MNTQTLIEKMTGSREDKKRWRAYKIRVKALPPNYRAAVEALERYLLYKGAITTGTAMTDMLDNLAELFEQSATNGTSIRAIVGDDPVAFADDFLSNYSDSEWINRERTRLTDAINQAAAS